MDQVAGPLWRTREGKAVLLAFAVLFLAAILRDPTLQGSWRLAATLALTLVFFALFGFAAARPSVPAFAALGALSLALTYLAPHSAVASLYAVVGGVAARLDLRRGATLAVMTAIGVGGIQYLRLGNSSIEALQLNGLGAALTYAGVYSIRRRQAEQERARQAEQESARAEERAHLARELHDVLAHSLSALTVQLDLAETLARQKPGDPRSLEAIERARSLAREGLQDARRAVSALRGESLPGPELLPKLAEDFERDTGVRCRVDLPAELPPLTSEERVAVYRTAQEALTNVRRHANASEVTLRLSPAAGGVELAVANDGRARADGERGGGFGLVGMRERAELLGGRLEAGPRDGAGFEVRLWLPA